MAPAATQGAPSTSNSASASAAEAPPPIDIDYAKFLDWLVDRKRVPKGWHTSLKSARAQCATARVATPLAAASVLPEGSEPCTYAAALRTLSLLLAPDAPAEWAAGPDKDMLGRYRGTATRAWATAVAAFERGDAHLADMAQHLVRSADVVAPAQLDRLARLARVVKDCARRERGDVRAAEDARVAFEEACDRVGVEHDAADFLACIESSVQGLVPTLLRGAVDRMQAKGTRDALAHYAEFAAFVAKEGEAEARECCPALQRVLDAEPDALVAPVRKPDRQGALDATGVEEAVVEAADGAGGIDWGISVAGTGADAAEGTGAAAAAIDWGISVGAEGGAAAESGAASEAPSAGIDWGITADAGEAGAKGGARQSSIDWSITSTAGGSEGGAEIDAAAAAIDWVVFPAPKDSGPPAASLADGDAQTLQDAGVREAVLNDLLELRGFLRQRVAERELGAASAHSLVLQQFGAVPACPELDALVGAVDAAVAAMNGAEARRVLCLLNVRARERVARELQEKKHAVGRLSAAITSNLKRAENARAEIAAENQRFRALAAETREVKKMAEEYLSKLYGGREVHILGEINNKFPPE